MSIALLVITDGRDAYLDQAVPSALANLDGNLTELWMYDDTGDEAYRSRLADRYPTFRHINGGPRRGFGGAIRTAWAYLRSRSNAQHVFHLEADFVFNRPVPLPDMCDVLDARPYLVQLALRRQPWNAAEAATGGIVEQHPDAYTDRTDPYGRAWLEHRLFFTTNPSLYRRSLCDLSWPPGDQSEGRFSHQLLRSGMPGVDPDQLRFGFWGARDSGEWVTHIGHHRAGKGY